MRQRDAKKQSSAPLCPGATLGGRGGVKSLEGGGCEPTSAPNSHSAKINSKILSYIMGLRMSNLEVRDIGPIPQKLANLAAKKYFSADAGLPHTRSQFTLENFEYLTFDGVETICLVARGKIFAIYARHPETGELVRAPWIRTPGEIDNFVSRKFWKKHDPVAVEKHDSLLRGDCR